MCLLIIAPFYELGLTWSEAQQSFFNGLIRIFRENFSGRPKEVIKSRLIKVNFAFCYV